MNRHVWRRAPDVARGAGLRGAYAAFDVPVGGGALRVGAWGDGPPVLAVHGITANHLSWLAVGEAAARHVRLLAPDLRGRGRSSGGPCGLEAHADDMVRLLDAVGAESAVVAGHSLGAFVAVVLAARHPDRVDRLVLVDGGLPLAVPAATDVDAALRAVIGPSLERLSMTFSTRDAYRAFWQAHPSFQDWDERMWRYLDYDLVGEEPELRSSVSREAVRTDAGDTLGPLVRNALERLAAPAVLVRAERGVLNEEPLLSDEQAARWPQVEDRGGVPGTNHFTILFAPAGVEAVAREVVEAGSA